MRSRSRLRTAVKWGGAALCAVLLVVWIGSPMYCVRAEGSRLLSRIQNGHADIAIGRSMVGGEHGVSIESVPDEYRTFPIGFYAGRNNRFWWVQIPLWAPLLAVLVPTVVAWRRDSTARRRPTAASPRCGYDRAGIAPDGPCPECGSAREAA